MVKEAKYCFGVYSGDDLRELVEKYTFEVENVSFEKTHALMEICVGIVCKLIAEGIHLDFQEIIKIWKEVNKKETKGNNSLLPDYPGAEIPGS
ncbi:MAG: hypothetical protein WC514_02505 [Candidatus Paceibacterota bacterium]